MLLFYHLHAVCGSIFLYCDLLPILIKIFMKIIKKIEAADFIISKKVCTFVNKINTYVYPKRVNTVKRLHGKNFKWEAIWCWKKTDANKFSARQRGCCCLVAAASFFLSSPSHLILVWSSQRFSRPNKEKMVFYDTKNFMWVMLCCRTILHTVLTNSCVWVLTSSYDWVCVKKEDIL